MSEMILRDEKHWRGVMVPLITAVAREFGITPQLIVDTNKLPTPRRARLVCYWLARRLKLRLTDTEIYRALGRKHAVIPRYVKQLDQLRETDEWLKNTTDRLLAELRST